MSKAITTPPKSMIAPREGSRGNVTCLKRILGDESGQVLPWVVVVMVVVLGMAALSVDLGRAMVIRRQLQVQADAAALAAAETLGGTSSYTTVGQNYSGASGDKNTNGSISVGTPTITPLCLTTVTNWGISCSSTSPNAVQVTETATIPTLFAQILGKPTLTLSATSTASPGRPEPYNVAVVLDTTPSMTDTDSSCGNKTQLACAVVGIQNLLKGLEPSLDSVSLFTFPGLDTNDVSKEYSCAGTNDLSVPPYTFPTAGLSAMTTMPYTYTVSSGGRHPTVTTVQGNATYQIVGYSNDYRTSDAATTLNSSSNLVMAVGGKSGCNSMGTGYENTYYAGAIYAAQSSLVAEQVLNPKAGNVMILLSDGNATAKQTANGSFSPGTNDMAVAISGGTNESTNVATSSGSYASWKGQCGQAVDAAQAASSAGTIVYTIAYGSPTSSNSQDCYSDVGAGSHPGITPCQTLQDMSTNYTTGDTSHFFSDYNFGGGSPCTASGSNSGTTAIADIYSKIAAQLTGARLIPNNTP
ncbi:MAG: pilus assembly protein TadG-related protein [Acidobacteriaceae bacterium]|jgi:Flp pilus assembly protein TadG